MLRERIEGLNGDSSYSVLKELKDPIYPAEGRIFTLEQLMSLLDESARRNYLLAETSGTFDLVHHGHLRYIESLSDIASRRAALINKDWLVLVGVNSNESTCRNKGGRTSGRPILDEIVRAEIVAGFRPVSAVFIFDDDWDLAKLRPDLLGVSTGSDHLPGERPEVAFLKEQGTEIVLLDSLLGYSTSSIIKKIKEVDAH